MGELKFYERVERKIGDAFASLGRFVSRHPWEILVASIIINLALGVGLLRLELITDAERVYAPEGSQARQDEARVNELFPDLSRTNFQKLQLMAIPTWASIIVRAKGGNILEGNALQEISELNNVIRNIVATKKDGTQIRITDICGMFQGECVVQGSLFLTPEFRAANERNDIPFPWFRTTNGVSNYKTFIGGRVFRNETHLRGMEYIKLEYNFRSDLDTLDDILKWCDAFLVVMESYSSAFIEVSYAHYDSLDEQLHDNVMGDLSLFAVTVTLMVGYSLLATVSARLSDSVGQRIMLGVTGWAATGLAILSSVGLCSAIGVEFVSIVGVSPFLVSGIGIDDMFILLSGLSGAQAQNTISEKMAETFRSSGVGITITTLTDLLAFGCGATSSFLSVRNFCIYTGVSVTFCYINHLTITGACIALNERRMAGNKHWFTCRRIKTREEAEADGHKRSHILCCTGRPPTSRDDAEGLLDKLPRWLLPKIVLYTPFKVIICLLFAGYLAGAAYGCVNLIEGIRFSELPSDSSYYYSYAITEENHFPRQSPVSFVFNQAYTYSERDIQDQIRAFVDKVKGDSFFEDDFEVNWLDAYKTTPFYNDTSEVAFIAGLESFLSTPAFSSFQNDVVIHSSKTRIIASRMYVRSRNLAGSQEEGNFMLKARELADDFELECFAFYPIFILYEQYVLVLDQTLLTVGVALLVVIVVTAFFMPHPMLILFCTTAVGMIMAGVFGYMYYIDVALSSITMVTIIMGIGFSVDFTAHICHGYMSSDGETRDIRVRGAINKTGAPITHGAISSLLGVAVLGAAKSYIFRTFATVVAFILGFGWAHALVLLPVVLSWIGPGTFESKKKQTNETSSLHKNRNIPKHFEKNDVGHAATPNGSAIPNGKPTRDQPRVQPCVDTDSPYVTKVSVIKDGDDVFRFDENAAVFRLYPDRRLRGSFRWESRHKPSGELTRDADGVRATM